MTRYIRKLRITAASGTVHIVPVLTTSHGPKETRALRKHGWRWMPARVYRILLGAVVVPHPIAVGRPAQLTEYVARRAGIVIQHAEEPAWMNSGTN